jgi:hypothetical protein
MTIETAAIAGSILASIVSVSAVVLSERRPRRAGPERTITITIQDPVTGLIRTVTRSTRRADQIRRDVEKAIRDGC